MHPHTPGNSVFDGPITNIISILCILIEILTRAHAKRGQSLNDFKFGTFIGRLPCDTVANMAVKRLTFNIYIDSIGPLMQLNRSKQSETTSSILCLQNNKYITPSENTCGALTCTKKSYLKLNFSLHTAHKNMKTESHSIHNTV